MTLDSDENTSYLSEQLQNRVKNERDIRLDFDSET